MSSAAGAAPARPVRARRGALVAALVPTVLGALFTLVMLAWAGGWTSGAGATRNAAALTSTAAFTAWALAPFAGAVAVAVLVHRRWPDALVAAASGGVLVSALAVALLWDLPSSESSTAGLVFVVLPVYQWLLVALAFAAAAVVHRVRGRR